MGILVVLLVVLPFLDRGRQRNPLRRPVATTIGIVLVVALVVLNHLGGDQLMSPEECT